MDLLQGSTVAIAGLGLMGGSLALALGQQPLRLVGVDPDEATRNMALERGLVDAVSDDFAAAVHGATLVALAAPVSAILAMLAQLPDVRPDGCLVLDLGSAKAAIVAAMDQLPPAFQAVGGHPMCGKEVSGLQAAEGGLFRDQTFVLCRSARTDSRAEAVAEELVAALGARALWLDAQVHDWMVAHSSHLPAFAAAALLAEAASIAATDERLWQVSAGGLRDTTRLAGSNPLMLRDTALTNRDAILTALSSYRRRLDEIYELLERGDGEGLYQWLAARRAEHTAYRAAKEPGSTAPPGKAGPAEDCPQDKQAGFRLEE